MFGWFLFCYRLFYAIETSELGYGVFGCIKRAHALCYAMLCMHSNRPYTGRQKEKNQIYFVYLVRTAQCIISTYVYMHVQQ